MLWSEGILILLLWSDIKVIYTEAAVTEYLYFFPRLDRLTSSQKIVIEGFDYGKI